MAVPLDPTLTNPNLLCCWLSESGIGAIKGQENIGSVKPQQQGAIHPALSGSTSLPELG